MSELDSLSDSDWLDIASRPDDDNDSISSHDELSSRPLSRRSSISFGSSHESEVEAWEGFVDDSGDESAVEPGMCLVQPRAAHATKSFTTGTIPDITQDASDDQQVKDALDQSMVGTLSASRASTTSHSTHNSIRDLRLSFPDPLTSSRDQLNKSYARVPHSGSATSLNEEPSPISLSESVLSSYEQEPEVAVTPPHLPSHQVPQQDNLNTNMGLDIVLYGCSSSIKWSFVQDFIQKAANFSGNVVFSSLDPTAGPVQTVDLRCGKDNSILTSITVHDYTNDNASNVDIFDFQDDVIRASLAIVYLPSTTLPILSFHTAYLPVLVPVTSDTTGGSSDTVVRHAAEDDWELLGVPANRTINLNTDGPSVLNADALSNIESWRIFGAIRSILDSPVQAIKSGPDNGHPVHAVTFFALVSIIMGFAFNTAFRTSATVPTATSKSASNSICGIFAPSQVNRTLAVPVASTGTSVIPSSPRDISLTVFNPGITSLSVASQVNSLSLTSRVTSLSVNPHGSSLSLIHTISTSLVVPGPSRHPAVVPDGPQASTSTDVMVRAVTPTSLSEIRPEPSTHTATRTQKKRHQPNIGSPNAVGSRLVDGLSEVLDVTSKALNSVVKRENGVKDLADAVDELMNAIHAQTQTVVSQSKGKARAFGEEVVSRNDRARGRAKQLKKKGEELLNSASSQFFERTEHAKKRARGLKESLMQSETWKTYEKAHAEWVSKLKNMEQCTKDKPGWGRRNVGNRNTWGAHKPAGVKRVDRPLRAR